MNAGGLDVTRCEALVARVVGGDAAARHALTELLWPHWLKLVRADRSMGSLARSDDHVHEVLTRLAEKLANPAGGLRFYASWRARNTDKTFGDWIRIVVKNQVRDYMRVQLKASPRAGDEPSRKRLLNEFAAAPVLGELGVRPPITAAQTARELLEFAQRQLPVQQIRVLGRWLEGADFDEIGRELALPSASARRLLRAAVATLRREFGGGAA